jgi:thiol:disulfide interchange protein DsbD
VYRDRPLRANLSPRSPWHDDLFRVRNRLVKPILVRVLLAALAFAGVAFLPDLLGLGPTGAGSDLGLGALLGTGSLLAFGVAFAGGVLTSLTPCVYPLIPITVSIFGAKRAARGEAMALSGLYVLGIAAMYSALGVGAALTGAAFGSVMSNPWVIGFVALVLSVLAASMFGAFDLQLPSAWQAKLEGVGGAGKLGAFAMGLVSGIIAAPCTGPVLAAALTFVAAKGSVAFGFGIMFVYALGMGLLFFLIGAFSVSLPKSGAWMDAVKSFFGVALLAAAGVFLKDALPALKPLFSAAREAALVAAGVAAVGVLLGALQGSFQAPWGTRLAKGLGVALLVGGIVYATGAAAARDRARLAAGFTWLHSEEEALALAAREGRPVIIDFWAEWCTACKELDRIAWSHPAVREEAARFVAVKLDGTESPPAFEAASDKYRIAGMPAVIFIDAKGREVPDRILSAIGPEEMVAKLRAVDGACEGKLASPLVNGALACPMRW